MTIYEVGKRIINEMMYLNDIEAYVESLKEYLDDDIEFVQVTLAFNEVGEWDVQEHSNEYAGRAYDYPYWLVAEIYQETSAQDVIEYFNNQLFGWV